MEHVYCDLLVEVGIRDSSVGVGVVEGEVGTTITAVEDVRAVVEDVVGWTVTICVP